MGEMSLRIDRRRKDLAASFNKLKYMVDDIKSARKSLAAHHRVVAEFVSVSFLSAVPSSIAPSPRDYPSDLKLDDPQEVGVRSTNGQIYDSQDVGTILQGPIAISALPIKSLSSELSAPVIFASPKPPTPPSACHGSLSALRCKNLKEADCVPNKFFASFYPQIVANHGKLTSQSILWASLLLAFLCFFLFMGKKVAIGITITAYSVLWLTFKGLSFSKKIPRFMRIKEFHPAARKGMHQNRSFIHVSDLLLSSPESHSGKGSQSVPTLHGCAQREGYTNERDLSINYTPSSNTGTHFARLKLGIMLVLALCGLAHGQIMAVCMCSSCVLMVSEMQRLALKRGKQGIKYNL